MMHIHVRNSNNEHFIDAIKYSEVFTSIRNKTGKSLFLEATTESVDKYNADEKINMVYELAELQIDEPIFGNSSAIKEVLTDSMSDCDITDFFQFLKTRTILPQLIIYDIADRNCFQDLLRRKVLPGENYPCFFVLVRHNKNQQSDPAELLPFFGDLYSIKN